MPETEDLFKLCGLLDRGELEGEPFFEAFTRALAGLIGCSRAGVWMFVDDKAPARTLRCIAMYDADLDLMVQVDDINSSTSLPYFEILLRNDSVVAPDAHAHPATRCFLEDYLLPLNIHSVLDMCFSIDAVPFGILSCEQVGTPMVWTQRQLQQLRQVGTSTGLCLRRAATAAVDTEPAALWETHGRHHSGAPRTAFDPDDED